MALMSWYTPAEVCLKPSTWSMNSTQNRWSVLP